MIDLEAGALVDRYSVVGILGEGGMATVYHVRHTRLASDHVLKVLSLPGRNVRDRLLLEGQVQARLKHRNVVEVTDVIDIQGAPGLVMELVRGPSLDAVLAKRQLPLELVEELVPGILAGVAAAHLEGVVHRDLKPANILLSVKRGRVVPKVADFGLVKIVDDDPARARTRTGATMGTPQYMAPEQIQSAKNVDARADIFALGAILYELVAGRRAFDGDSHYEIFQQVVERTYPPLLDLRPDAPDRMLRAIEAAFADQEDRPATAEALWELWREGDEPLEAAASRAGAWPEDLATELSDLAPTGLSGLETSGSSFPSSGGSASSDTGGPTSGAAAGSASHTFVADGDPVVPQRSSPTMELPPDPAPTTAPTDIPPPSGPRTSSFLAMGGVVAVVSVLLLGAAVAALLVTLVVRNDTGPPTDTAPSVAPAPVAPMPAVPTPIPPPAVPAPVPGPVPVEPSPVEPTPTPPEPVEPLPPTPDAPAPAPDVGTATVGLTGGTPVTLIGADGARHSIPGDVPAGSYTVSAEFSTGSVQPGKIELAEGSRVTIRCVEAMKNCTW